MSIHLPSTAALRAFEAAARHLSFTEAAEELGRTQGAISHQIKELEERLETTLFVREGRGISLSPAGRTYLPFVVDALSRLRAGYDALKPQEDTGVLTVSCSPNFAAKWLVPRLGDFSSAHPDLDLRISAAARHVTFEGDGIDLAVRHGKGGWPELQVVRLCPETLFPVCSPHILESLAPLTSVRDLARYPLIHDQSREGWGSWLLALGEDLQGLDLSHGPVFSQTSLAIDAAVAGQGVALARSALVGLDLAANRLVRPLSQEVPADFAYWIVCPKDRATQPKIKRFHQWLLEQN